MKKKYRDIVVNDVSYAWAYSGGELKIWKNKQIIYKKYVDFSDVQVTPSYIAELITMIEDFGDISNK